MRSNVVRVIVGITVVVFAVALLLVLKSNSEENKEASSDSGKPQQRGPTPGASDTTERPGATIVVRNGEPVGGVAELQYNQGELVHFEVSSDVADEIHLHGYDISKEVEAGGTAEFSFPAEIEGIFEVELEERAVQIAELQVNP